MNNIKLIIPINTPETLISAKQHGADIVYINFKQDINLFKSIADSIDIPLYIYFPSKIESIDFQKVTSAITDAVKYNIPKIMINDYSVLKLTENIKGIKIHIDSGLNIHNSFSYEYLKDYNIESINITEEVYLKNVLKIKEIINKEICISINNIVWAINEARKHQIDYFQVDGVYHNSESLLQLTKKLKQILTETSPDSYLEDKQIQDIIDLFETKEHPFHFQTDHFYKTFKDNRGQDFEFAGNIKKIKYSSKQNCINSRTDRYLNILNKNHKLRLRLTKLDQITSLRGYIDSIGTNFIDIIEFGYIINTDDLNKLSYIGIINQVKTFCKEFNIKLFLSTPEILIERDFDRVLNHVKYLCFTDPKPHGLIINNLGLINVINDKHIRSNLDIELGYSFELYNNDALKYFEPIEINGINIPTDCDIQNIEDLLLHTDIKNKSIVVLGVKKLKTYGLCPLNNDLPYSSRLKCKAPCRKINYAIYNPHQNDYFPMILDGFCKLHVYDNIFVNKLKDIDNILKAGVTDFILDMSFVPETIINKLLDIYIQAINSSKKHIKVSEESKFFEVVAV